MELREYGKLPMQPAKKVATQTIDISSIRLSKGEYAQICAGGVIVEVAFHYDGKLIVCVEDKATVHTFEEVYGYNPPL